MAGASEERLASLRELLADEPGDAFLSYSVAMQLKGLGRAQEAAEQAPPPPPPPKNAPGA